MIVFIAVLRGGAGRRRDDRPPRLVLRRELPVVVHSPHDRGAAADPDAAPGGRGASFNHSSCPLGKGDPNASCERSRTTAPGGRWSPRWTS